MIVYHGSTEIVEKPDVKHSCRRLDFGIGFYVTTVREQAERWARRKADIRGEKSAIVNIYQMGIWDKERALKEIKVYPSYDQIAFISQRAIKQLLKFESFEGV